MKKKIIITVVLGAILVIVYTMIFSFSSENAEESSKASRTVMNFVLDIYDKLFGMEAELSVADEEGFPLEKIIRKTAHFVEYMAVGFLSFSIATLWVGKLRYGVAIVIAQLLLSAIADELHQYFVPGRYASVTDVVIDTVGGMVGILSVSIIIVIKSKNKKQSLQKK